MWHGLVCTTYRKNQCSNKSKKGLRPLLFNFFGVEYVLFLADGEKIEARNELLALAVTFLGIKENTEEGKKFIATFLASVGLSGNLPWCAAFVSYCIEQIEKKHGPSGVVQSAGVMDMWNRTPKEFRVQSPEKGAVAIYQSQKNGKLTSTGHAGLVLDYSKTNIFNTIEGNTGSGDGINRDGDGVYKKNRPFPSTYASLVLRGFILPWK